MELWLSPKECAGLSGLPKTPAGVIYVAKKQGWNNRARAGIKGGKAIEYNIESLPIEARAELLLKQGVIETSQGIVELARPTVNSLDYERQALWQRWDSASDVQRQLAGKWHPVVMLADELINSGVTAKTAFQTAARQFQVSAASLRDKYYQVQKYAKSD
ncbi:DNA-binding protein, partial [Citrobacter koseri]